MSQSELIPGKIREPQIGDVYSGRDEYYYQVLYVDDQVVLLRDQQESDSGENYHRIERRSSFEMMIDAGHFEYEPDVEIDLRSDTVLDWSEVGQIGEKTSSNLHDAGYTTRTDIQLADDDELLAVNGVGQKGLSNLKQF